MATPQLTLAPAACGSHHDPAPQKSRAGLSDISKPYHCEWRTSAAPTLAKPSTLRQGHETRRHLPRLSSS